MITQINEDELFFITLENNIILKQHCNNFKERIGIKMESEDGTNFLQGIACCDIVKTSNMADNVQIWVNPKCINTNYNEVLKFHINKLSEKYKEENKDSNHTIFQNKKNKENFANFMAPPDDTTYKFSTCKNDKNIICEVKAFKDGKEIGNLKYELIETLRAFVIKFIEINYNEEDKNDNLLIHDLIKFSEDNIITYISNKIIGNIDKKPNKIKLFKLSVRKDNKEFLNELSSQNYIEDKNTKNIVYLYKEF